MDLKKKILFLTLENAVKYDGKASFGAVVGHLLAEDSGLKRKMKELSKVIQSTTLEVNDLTLDEQKAKLKEFGYKEKKKEERVGLKNLPNVTGKVVMRMAPYPSGPLHIGNARTAILNDEYVRKYGGKLILFIDDTIGSKEKEIVKDAYKLIPEGLKWAGLKFDKKVYYKSDRLEIYYKYAKEIIKKGKAYVCSCNQEKLRENRKKGISCDCRSASVEETLKLWEKMFSMKEGKAALRIKTDMKHPNPAFRDRVLFRISERKHPKVGKKYKVWPLLDFSWAVDDHLLKMTHIIRGKELMIESDMERYIWKIFGWKPAQIIHNGLFQIEGVKISKSKSSKEVKSGLFKGWADPRTWSLQSLEKRGILPEAIRNFVISMGLNQTEIVVPIDSLYSENKKLIDKKANRYFFIEDGKKIKIKDAPKIISKAPLHPDFPRRGSRKIKTNGEFYVQDKFEKGKMYRFMHLFNFKDGKFVSEKMDRSLNAKLVHWLPVSKDLVKVEIIMDDGKIKKGLAESNIKKLKVGEIIQFERFGFCRLDKKGKVYVFYFAHK